MDMGRSKNQYVQLQSISHDQHLNNSNSPDEDFEAALPSPFNDKDLVASYPEQPDENINPCSNCVSQDLIKFLLYFMLFSAVVIPLNCFFIYATHTDLSSPYGDFIYKHHLKTNQYGIDYYVKSGFDNKYPIGSPERAELEKSIDNDYLNLLQSQCHDELWQKWTSVLPDDYSTPNCDELKRMDVKIIPFSSMIP